MNKVRDARGVPGDGAASVTPPSKDQLKMTSDPYDVAWLTLGNGSRRLVLIDYTEGAFATVHAAIGWPNARKAYTERRFEQVIGSRMTPHTLTDEQEKIVRGALEGRHDEQAEKMGYDSGISYVLHRIERGESGEGREGTTNE